MSTDPSNRVVERPVAVYRLYDSAGSLLYIGASTNPTQRLKAHVKRFGNDLDPAAMTLEWYGTRGEADVAEYAAITAHRPRGNRAGTTWPYIPYRQPLYPAPVREPYVYVQPGPDPRFDPNGPDFSVATVRYYLKLSAAVVSRLAAAGAFPGARKGAGGWQIPQAGIIAYILGRQRARAIEQGWVQP